MHRRRFSIEAEMIRLPQPPTVPMSPSGFVLFPPMMLQGLAVGQWLMQQWLYQRAWAEAQAVARPSLLERDLAGVWN